MTANRDENVSIKRERFLKFFTLYAMIVSTVVCYIELAFTDIHEQSVAVNCTTCTVCLAVSAVLLFVVTMNDRVSGNLRTFVILCDLEWLLLITDFYTEILTNSTSYGVMLAFVVYAYYAMVGIMTVYYWYAIVGYYDKGADARPVKVLLVLYAVLLVVNHWTGLMFSVDVAACELHRTSLSAITIALPLALMVYSVLALYGKVPPKQRTRMFVLLLLPVIGMTAQLVNRSFDIIGLSFLLALIGVFSTFYYSRGVRISEQALMIEAAKMRPHFIFNSLGAIMNIEGNPEPTKEALLMFSSYLRSNLDTMGQPDTVPLEVEMDNVEAYVYLEKLRLKSKLNVDYNLKTKDFKVPPFTVEVLVENAIKHGIIPKTSPGHVKVESWSDDTNNYVRVVDDGVGFDKNAPADTSRSHVGLKNLRERIVKTCGGTLAVESIVGMGTVSTVTLPKKEKKR